MPSYSWKEIWRGRTEPYTANGIAWGGYTIVCQLQRERRKSKGWRRHIRRQKQAKVGCTPAS
jgi:hypothetical protein